MQFKGYNDDGLPHDPAGGQRNSSGSPARNYAIGAACIVVAVLSFAFLTGSTAVFIGIAGAIAGTVFLIMGVQAADERQPEPSTQDPGADYDWDGNFRREFGDGQHR